MEETTVETITNWLQYQVKNNIPIHAGRWLEEIAKLNVLLEEEQSKYFDYQQEVAKKKVEFMESGNTGILAKAKIESLDVFKEMNKQKAKIDRVIEMIRIGKLQSKVSDDVYHSN